MNPAIITLGEVLQNPEQHSWKLALYVEPKEQWDAHTRAAVLDPNETEDPDEEPEFAKQNGLRYALEIGAVKEIVDNAREQRPSATVDELLAAFNYYYDRDAFIDFG